MKKHRIKKSDQKRPGISRQAMDQRRQTQERADCGPIPQIFNPDRRESCRLDLYRFGITYFPQTLGSKPLSDEHRKAIGQIEGAILGTNNGREINAMPRGFVKSTIAEVAVIWAACYGHKRYGVVLALNKNLAREAIDSIKMEFAENDLLCEDFPEICVPIRALENKPQRCKSQTCDGKLTYITWTSDTIVLPTIAGSVASGAIVAAKPFKKARGLRHKLPNGTQQRPDLVIIDDPQDNEIAENPNQVNKALAIIRKDIARLASHSGRLAVVMNATVIALDDVVETLLKDPSWEGVRVPMVKQFPKADKTHWRGPYATLRRSFDRDIPGDKARAIKAGNDYYAANREIMDECGIVTWEQCYIEGQELSALQHAYNILIDDGEEAFASECQNKPLEPQNEQIMLRPEQITGKLSRIDRLVVPVNCSHVTAFIDAHDQLLYYLVAAWRSDFTGYIIDYGAYPDPGRRYFSLEDFRKNKSGISRTHPGLGFEGAMFAALEACCDNILGREYHMDGGGTVRVSRCLIDANWGDSTETVYDFCRRSKHAALLFPSHGRSFGASTAPLSEWKAGRYGSFWRIIPPDSKRKRPVSHIIIDANHWKTTIYRGLSAAQGEKGSVYLYGDRPELHQLLAEHITAEYPEPVKSERTGARVDEWKPKPNRDNHWFDCLVGCAVAASYCGVSASGQAAIVKRQRVKLSDLQRQKWNK